MRHVFAETGEVEVKISKKISKCINNLPYTQVLVPKIMHRILAYSVALKLSYLLNDWFKFYKRAHFGNRKGSVLKKYKKEFH